ncbi:MAG TPA: folylpolyglutamate synthase/dihydrofolate synthase family protein [Luteolibacter sp.]|nr:folylpolyglutamate synthase/dihydrofolate synthase family protein [Luteolibacter sp.]
MTYREAIDWLFSVQTFGIKLGLDNARLLLRRYLAHPPHDTKVIHVAGTNGKGSTCAMTAAIARAAGLRTGLFTSPHLIDFRERIEVNGEQIPQDACAAMLTELRSICESLETHPTFFEITLALAMRWFNEQHCELIVLETGMGGRLDATTAVPADVCAITPIGMDHMEWLGDTIEAIAAEKAGIMVAGKPTISAPQTPAARRVLEEEANERRSPLEFVTEPLLGYSIGLEGEHQRWNAALAVSLLHHAGVALNADIVRHGLGRLHWPGRFERFGSIVLDGAHNPPGAEVLAHTWRECFPGIKPTLIFSALAAKDISGILATLAPLAARILICAVNSPRACTPAQIAACLPAHAPPHQLHPNLEQAMAAAREHKEPILIAGSLFLVGEARALLTGATYQQSTQ